MESYQYARFLLESGDSESSAQYYSQILVKSFSGHPRDLFDISRSLIDSIMYLTKVNEYSTLRNFSKTLRKEFNEETDTINFSNEMTQVVELCKEIFQLAILVAASEGNRDKSEYRTALKKAGHIDHVTGNVHSFLSWVKNL